MKVTAKVYKVDIKGSNLVAFATITLDGLFVVKGLKVMNGSKGLWVSMPSEKGKDEKYYDTAYPLTADLRKDINEVVLSEYDNTAESTSSSNNSSTNQNKSVKVNDEEIPF